MKEEITINILIGIIKQNISDVREKN